MFKLLGHNGVHGHNALSLVEMVLCKDQEIVQFKELVLAEATREVPVMKEIVVSEHLMHKNWGFEF